ncbi:MAG: 3-methyl-2-oxobutanoate hydroxymethyltransferase [Verrucomicrobia bacterium]|nr:3-methyl-2-oxobutanoate hydroxymethyltransferase [Verrucomicrobiota bacterium]
MNPALERIRTAKAQGRKIAALTAYDYPTAKLVDESGIDLILVGDSLGMVVLGLPDTVEVTMDDMLHHTRAAARGVERALLVADLPARSYENPADAVRNARRLVEAGAHAVKLEGGVRAQAQIAAITAADIPLLAHIGMLPQSVREEGGYKIKGRSEEGARALLADARAVEAAGAFGVVIELATPAAARDITAALAIPTIGIGAGTACDGQILVLHDLVGLFPWFRPKFVTAQAEVGAEIRAAAASYIAQVRGETPRPDGRVDGT